MKVKRLGYEIHRRYCPPPVGCFPESLGEYIATDNPVRFIDAFVDSLDLAELGFAHTDLAETGRPTYDPRDLLKLYPYGYLNRVRSSRKLELECQRNVEAMWLLGKLRPDRRLSQRQPPGL